MQSKSWTIVSVTLTLLVFGCSKSDVARVQPAGSTTVAAALPSTGAAALPSNLPSDTPNLPIMPDDVGVQDPLEIPSGFAPPQIEAAADFPSPFGSSRVLLPVVKAIDNQTSDSFDLIGFVDAHALKSLVSKTSNLKLVRIKDESSDVQVVAVEATVVTTKQGNKQAQLNLFGQPGFHEAKSIVDVSSASFAGQPIHGLDMPQGPGFPFGVGPAGAGEAGMPPMPGMQGLDNEPVGFPGLDGAGHPVDPTHMFNEDRDPKASGPGFPNADMQLPGAGAEQFGQLPGVSPARGLPELPPVPSNPGNAIVQ